MTKITAIITAILIFYTTTFTAHAGLDSDLEGFFDDLGIMSNMQVPGSYESGGRKMLSGGSLSMRFKTTIPPVVTYSPPSLRVSCSGLDFNAGMISILGLDMIQKILQQGGASLAWGLLIGLAYSLPTVSGVFEKIQKYTRWLQMLQGDMCQIGKNIGQSIGGNFNTKAESTTKAEKVTSGSAGTFVEAAEDIFDNMTEYTKKLRGNIIYDALGQGTGLSDESRRALMTLLGTVVWYPSTDKEGVSCTASATDGVRVAFNVVVPTFDTQGDAAINSLVNGGELLIRECGSTCSSGLFTTCTAPKDPPSKITVTGLAEHAKTVITDAIMNLSMGEELTAEQENYLNTPVMPGYNEMIMYYAALKRQGVSVENELALISTFYGYWYLEQLMTFLNELIHTNKSTIINMLEVPADAEERIENFFTNYRTSSSKISYYLAEKRKDFVELISKQGNIMAFINQYSTSDATQPISSFTESLGSAGIK